MQQQSLLAVRCVKRLRVKWSRKLSTFVMPRLYFVAFLTGKRFFRFASSINDDEFLFERKKKKETKFHSTAYLDCLIWNIQTQHLFQPGKKKSRKKQREKTFMGFNQFWEWNEMQEKWNRSSCHVTPSRAANQLSFASLARSSDLFLSFFLNLFHFIFSFFLFFFVFLLRISTSLAFHTPSLYVFICHADSYNNQQGPTKKKKKSNMRLGFVLFKEKKSFFYN